ncbi:translation initiation factor IF-3 [Reinekea thalattae]|uniref:Translation initiation factor IF-3 n=1 Tax=Reinekea thalattae TaxID=2593301 RepID=A0A5C8Z1Q9_9GAMM|nr:translation initiation factor IF-3 [Reinekea thalattae]TXR52092.1 translation initiation factor IF-3 [Reinekea thalattae]
MKRNARTAKNDSRHVINEQIDATEVRLISAEGEQLGITPLDEAIAQAKAAGLELVQISNADPVVAKIMDLGKKLYEEKKQKAAARKKQSQVQVKEIKFRPNTDIGDYNVKLRNLTRFLEEGNKAKVTLRYRGREMAHQELGMELLKRVENDLEDFGTVEQRPKMEGRQLTMVLAPVKKK